MEKNYVAFEEDKAGFFYVYLDDARRNIVVEHYEGVIRDVGKYHLTSTGKINKVFKGTTAEALYRTIIGNGLISRLDHAAYLGHELAKAETALRNGLRYEQDRPLKV